MHFFKIKAVVIRVLSPRLCGCVNRMMGRKKIKFKNFKFANFRSTNVYLKKSDSQMSVSQLGFKK